MGNALESEPERSESMQALESRVGKQQLSGRYHKPPKKLKDDYEVSHQVLGSGFNGVVRMGTGKIDKEQKVAVKAFKLAGLQPYMKAQLESEVEIILRMDHPHVIRLYDVYESKDALTLVMECCEGGEVFDRITELKQFSERDAADSVWQMLLAVNYLHSHSIVHRDLKLENFLYDRKNSSHLKLIDFGFSKAWEPNVKMHVSCGTLSYVAPEVLKPLAGYTKQCDLWSLGVVAFVLLSGHMPFSGAGPVQQKNIAEGNYKMKPEKWKNISEEATGFVKALLELDPSKRLTAQGALQHPWIAKRHVWGEDIQDSGDADVVQALRDFGHATKFRRCCMEVMAWSLSNEERSQVRDHFIRMDKNKTGTLTLKELKEVLVNKFHIPDAETKDIFEALDSRHDEEVHYSDFLAAMVNTRIALHDDLLKQAFKRFDVDNTGFITKENMVEVLGETFEGQEVESLMAEADFTQHGRISYPEFVAYLKNQPLETHKDAVDKLIDSEMRKTPTGEYGRGMEHRKIEMLKTPASTPFGNVREGVACFQMCTVM